MMRDLSTLYENAGTNHGVFLDWWNTTKSLFNIWLKNIQEIDMEANSTYLAAMFSPFLVCPQRTTFKKLHFLHIFEIS